MQDYTIKSCSSDISFCAGNCSNKDCDRNMDGELFNRAKKAKDFYYAVCDFSKECSKYEEKK